VDELVDGIGDTVLRVLERAEDSGASPLGAARALARKRLSAVPVTPTA
jgi:hypothetical protein